MSDYITHTKEWLAKFVIGLNLCPFAKQPYSRDKIRYVVYEDEKEEALMKVFLEELYHLDQTPVMQVETSLIIHPNCLMDFRSYLNFVQVLENLLAEAAFQGVFQIASFHPDYQFAGTGAEDAENYTNRSPYPMIHLLREESVEKALEHYENPESIPDVNIQKMNALGIEGILKLKNQIDATKR